MTKSKIIERLPETGSQVSCGVVDPLTQERCGQGPIKHVVIDEVFDRLNKTGRPFRMSRRAICPDHVTAVAIWMGEPE